MKSLLISVVVFAIFVFLQGPIARAQAIIPLGTVGGLSSYATGINDSGQVTGDIYNSSGVLKDGFLYSNGTMTDLVTASGYNDTYTTGINNSGQIVGTTNANTGGTNAYIYSNGVMTIIPNFIGNYYGYGNGINNAGQVVGYRGDGVAQLSFVYSGGTITNLGSLAAGQNTSANGINSSGSIVGSAVTNGGINATVDPVLFFSNGTVTDLGLPPNAGSDDTEAVAINASGQILANSYGGDGVGDADAFLYSNGMVTDLGSLYSNGGSGSFGKGLNNAGQVVGFSVNAEQDSEEAFFYSASTGMENLDTIFSASLVKGGAGSPKGFVYLVEADGINNSGQIAGTGEYWNGTQDIEEAFLLTIPEPSTWALFIGGLGVLIFLRSQPRRI